MRLAKINILPLLFAVFSLFTVQCIVYPFQEFRLKYRLEIVQKSLRVRKRTCRFVAASAKLSKMINLCRLRSFFRFAVIILQQHIQQCFKSLIGLFNSFKLLLMAFFRVVLNFSHCMDYWFPAHSF
jgi:hypothetical protein